MNATRTLALLALALGAAAGGLVVYVINAYPPRRYGASTFLWDFGSRQGYERVESLLFLALTLSCVAGACLLVAVGRWWRDEDRRGPPRDRWQRAAGSARDW